MVKLSKQMEVMLSRQSVTMQQQIINNKEAAGKKTFMRI